MIEKKSIDNLKLPFCACECDSEKNFKQIEFVIKEN